MDSRLNEFLEHPQRRSLSPEILPLNQQMVFQVYRGYMNLLSDPDQLRSQALLNYQDVLISQALYQDSQQQLEDLSRKLAITSDHNRELIAHLAWLQEQFCELKRKAEGILDRKIDDLIDGSDY